MVSLLKRFQCEVCKCEYKTEEEAYRCERVGLRGVDPAISVGDYIELTIYKAYGWHNAPEAVDWYRELTEEERVKTHHGCGRYVARGVVTAITTNERDRHEGHNVRYSIVLPVFHSGATEHCWTSLETHAKIHKLEMTDAVAAWKEENFNQWEGKKSHVLL